THARHGSRRAAPTSPHTTAPRRTSNGKHPMPTPSGSPTVSDPGSREPRAPVTTQPATPPPPPTITSESPPPAVEAPTVPELPKLPELPVKLPVKVPSIPGLLLPGVK